jgi:hypothetical protein
LTSCQHQSEVVAWSNGKLFCTFTGPRVSKTRVPPSRQKWQRNVSSTEVKCTERSMFDTKQTLNHRKTTLRTHSIISFLLAHHAKDFPKNYFFVSSFPLISSPTHFLSSFSLPNERKCRKWLMKLSNERRPWLKRGLTDDRILNINERPRVLSLGDGRGLVTACTSSNACN